MKKGFTLIELLVVIFIIGLLAAIVIVSVDYSRVKARDAKRRADLASIRSAVESYADLKATYTITFVNGTACGQTGAPSTGWLNYDYNTGTAGDQSIGAALINNGILTNMVRDPVSTPATATTVGYGDYMYYTNGTTYSIMAHLENPNADASGWDKASSYSAGVAGNTSPFSVVGPTSASYMMNYLVGNGY